MFAKNEYYLIKQRKNCKKLTTLVVYKEEEQKNCLAMLRIRSYRKVIIVFKCCRFLECCRFLTKNDRKIRHFPHFSCHGLPCNRNEDFYV
ncbi:hypothetical protein C0J00_04750 [Streptococcus pluranimalium]|uniref:Uncharacterized protein n=1 Tax=Streptococcus pluranimalium TaxID=82348 RepID=A0A2L0D3T6_9STRE|nr:hypothetical protein C0J00_04750 [Streptococcus pluranimalium]